MKHFLKKDIQLLLKLVYVECDIPFHLRDHFDHAHFLYLMLL